MAALSSSKLTGAALQVIGPGGPGVVAADTAAKIKFDSCMHPVLIRCKSTNKRRKKMIYFKDLKKGQEIKSSQLHPFILCSGKLLESPKQGRGIRKTILIDAKGSELGFFDEAGSVYSSQIKLAKVNGNWEKVTHAPS